MPRLTPHPRILRTLGEIPFAPWQCIAEIVDNSLDAFLKAENAGTHLTERRIIVSWSGDAVAADDRSLEIIDTGPGMTPATLENALRAGYSGNNPVDSLGLFGMGFNIATARLGEKTQVLSATAEAKKWFGTEIDFAELERKKSFDTPDIKQPKRSPSEHGTKIVVTRLKPGIVSLLRTTESRIRQTLEDIYTPILGKTDVNIVVQSKTLTPKPHCVWNENRYISTREETIPAVIRFDDALGDSFFDIDKNRYLTPDEENEFRQKKGRGGALPAHIVSRRRSIFGWVGIQRFADPDDFGIDFIRNGRKILIGDKTLFSYFNAVTGRSELEYPVELGNTVGGRIVGEIHVDHLPPTYQKNDFDRSDPSWYEVVDYLRGAGPILPNKRKALGFAGNNTSPLGRLVNGYRRVDQGTRCLFAPNKQAREWADKFAKGAPEYASDEKWWRAAQEADRARADKGASQATAVDAGEQPTDNPAAYGVPGGPGNPPTSLAVAHSTLPQVRPPESDIEAFKRRSSKNETLSGEYSYRSGANPLQVTVWEIVQGVIQEGVAPVPCAFFTEGRNCDYFYDPRHAFFQQFQTNPYDLLLIYLAEKLNMRDAVRNIAKVFSGLMENEFDDQRIDESRIQEQAKTIFDELRESMSKLLVVREQEVLECIHESAGEVEETVSRLTSNPELLRKFQSRHSGGIDAIAVSPTKTLIRLVERFPEELLDGKFFRTPFCDIVLPDTNATERLRANVKERLLTYLRDAFWVIGELPPSNSPLRRKSELVRCAQSLEFLRQEILN